MPRRASSTSFKPGQSGNPGGRPKIVGDLRELARVHTHEALATLVRVAQDRKAPPAAQVAAAEALLNRGYGKPVQAVEASGPEGGEIVLRFARSALPDEGEV